MLHPTDNLTITLTIAEWNQIMAMLGEQKYQLVAGLIQKINQQAAMQTQNDQDAPAAVEHRSTAQSPANGPSIGSGAD
jgi:hypothetical protein